MGTQTSNEAFLTSVTTKATVITGTSTSGAVLFGMPITDAAAIVGIVSTVVVLVANLFFHLRADRRKQREDRRQQKEHEMRMQKLLVQDDQSNEHCNKE